MRKVKSMFWNIHLNKFTNYHYMDPETIGTDNNTLIWLHDFEQSAQSAMMTWNQGINSYLNTTMRIIIP